MKKTALIRLMENRVATLNGLRTTAELNGEIARVSELDEELVEAQQILEALRSIP